MIKKNPILKNVFVCRWKNVIYMKYNTKICRNMKPLRDEDRIFTNLYGRHDWHLNSAICRGDWHKTREIIVKGPEWIVNELANSGIQGRGGAYFPLGKKLKFMEKSKAAPPRYVLVNGAEGEPGTCKDREIMRHEPHKIIEGTLLLGRAISAKAAWIFIRGRFYNEICNLQTAVLEAYEAGLVGVNACDSGFDFDIFLQRGGGRYIAGEETALINCLMGSEANPRRKPPFPSERGIWDKPTTVINVETVSIVPTLCRRGSKWFSELGVWPHNPGTKLFNISGNVERPCTVEETHGLSLRKMIEKHAGGVKGGWNNLLAVIPGGFCTPMLHKSVCDNVTLDSKSLETVNSALGTGAIIVFDKSHDILEAIRRILRFYKKSSCHQCAGCRGQSLWAFEFVHQFQMGIGYRQEIDLLWDISKWAPESTICKFAEGNSNAIQGFLRHFRGCIEKKLGLDKKS